MHGNVNTVDFRGEVANSVLTQGPGITQRPPEEDWRRTE